MGYDITIYRHIWCDITPEHPKTPGQNNFNENRPYCCGLRFFFVPCLCPPLALSPAWPFLSSFCCPSHGHVVGLTVPPANINLVPSRLRLLPQCMIVFVPFSLSFFPCLFFLRVIHIAWYRYRYIPKMFSILISIRTKNMKMSHHTPRNLDTIPNTSFLTTSVSYMRVFLVSHAHTYIYLSGNKAKYLTSRVPGIRYIGAILQWGSRLCVDSSFGLRIDSPCVVFA